MIHDFCSLKYNIASFNPEETACVKITAHQINVVCQAVFLPACYQQLWSYLHLLCWCHTGRECPITYLKLSLLLQVLLVRQAIGNLLNKTGGIRSYMLITYSYVESSWSMLLCNTWSAKKQLSSFSLSTRNLFAKRGAQQEPLSKPSHLPLAVPTSPSGLEVFPSILAPKRQQRRNIHLQKQTCFHKVVILTQIY